MEAILCWLERTAMVKKKVKKITYKISCVGRDYSVGVLLTHYNLHTALSIYNLVTTSPIDIVVFVLSSKFGLSKFAIMIIFAFLI
jgi:hypothetical protein